MKAAVRHAEASRISSCAFADAVAGLSLQTYRSLCPEDLLRSYNQTVMSAFLVQNEDMSTHAEYRFPLTVVSIGVGTKFLPWNVLCDNKTQHVKLRHRLKDCHAEVLSRRGLLYYLLSECKIALAATGSVGGSKVVELRPDGMFVLRAGVRVHFYSSSSPCGNASVKKWAKGKGPTVYPHLSPSQYPDELHDRLHITARADGQVAVLLKRSRARAGMDPPASPNILKPSSHAEDKAIPPGTAAVSSGCGAIMTCSDKIAKWNAIGVQGGLLSTLFADPIYISTCTVGRKYSKPILQRALCCRLQDFQHPTLRHASKKRIRCAEISDEKAGESPPSLVCASEAPRYRTHHPVMLSTSVKFDDGVVLTGEVHGQEEGVIGAAFNQPMCLVWGRHLVDGAEAPESSLDIIDSRSGFVAQDTDCEEILFDSNYKVSKFSGCGLFREYLEVVELHKLLLSHPPKELAPSGHILLCIDRAAYSCEASTACLITFFYELNNLRSAVSSSADAILTTGNLPVLEHLANSFERWKFLATRSGISYFDARLQLISDPMLFGEWIIS